MKESREQVEAAIILLGESLDIKTSAELLLINVGIHSTIKELIYKMFVLDRQPYFEKDDRVFEAMTLIKKYCQEMGRNGEVIFSQK
jgi:hypothetical protein